GWQSLREWAANINSGPCQWGIEGAWNCGRGLAQQLVAAGHIVYEVNPRWTAQGRRQARRPGKTDRLDARAVARCVRQEAPHLPAVVADDVTAVLDLLTSQREAVINETSRLWNQLHALLLQLDPEYKERLPPLESAAGQAALAHYEAPDATPIQQARATAVRRLVERLQLGLAQAKDLAAEIRKMTKDAGFAPLTEITGVALLTAGTLAGILGPGCRFRTDAEFAAYAGVAPLEASSAGAVRHRLNRSGNRRLNAILHMMAITQLRCWEPAKKYVARRLTEGKTRREALRALKRYLARAVWQAWKRCLASSQATDEIKAATQAA
ncbi:MAG: hypothetical protein QOF51_1744, partial [Chloroflexota bacterium]|nr:hypothetical protein [Chloroflexota bacterium]